MPDTSQTIITATYRRTYDVCVYLYAWYNSTQTQRTSSPYRFFRVLIILSLFHAYATTNTERCAVYINFIKKHNRGSWIWNKIPDYGLWLFIISFINSNGMVRCDVRYLYIVGEWCTLQQRQNSSYVGLAHII